MSISQSQGSTCSAHWLLHIVRTTKQYACSGEEGGAGGEQKGGDGGVKGGMKSILVLWCQECAIDGNLLRPVLLFCACGSARVCVCEICMWERPQVGRSVACCEAPSRGHPFISSRDRDIHGYANAGRTLLLLCSPS